METGAKATCDKESHWKLSPVSLQYDAADGTDDVIFGMAPEVNCQVQLVCTHHTPKTYDVWVSTWVNGRGAWTTSLWPIIGRLHSIRQETL